MNDDDIDQDGEGDDAGVTLATLDVIAATMRSPAMYERVLGSGITAADFGGKMGDAWTAIQSTVKGGTVNPTAVEMHLSASLHYTRPDARRLLHVLLERSHVEVNDEAMVDNLGRIRHAAGIRRMRDLGRELMATKDSVNVAAAAGDAARTIERIIHGSVAVSTTSTIQDLLVDFTKRIENPTKDTRRVRLGIPALDDLMGGGAKLGNTIVFGADSHVGKTTFLKHMVNFVSATEPVGIITFESTKEEIVDGLVEMEAGVPLDEVADADGWARVIEARERLMGRVILLDVTEAMTVEEVASRLHIWMVEHGVTVVFIDYVQDIERSTRHARDDLNYAHISKTLRRAAKKNRQILVEFAQLSEEESGPGKTKPSTADGPHVKRLAYTKQWRKDASAIIMADRKDTSDDPVIANVTRFFLRKNRFNRGKLGRAWMFYDSTTTRVEPCDGNGRRDMKQGEMETTVDVNVPESGAFW